MYGSSGVYEEYDLQRNMLPPSSGLKIKPSIKPAEAGGKLNCCLHCWFIAWFALQPIRWRQKVMACSQ
jgi:hypothetical protein